MAWTDSVYAALHPPRRRGRVVVPTPADVDAFAPGTPNVRPQVERAQLAPANQLNVRAVFFSSIAADLLLTGSVRQADGTLQPIGPNGAGFTFSTVGDRSVRTKDFALGFGVGATLNSLQAISLTTGVTIGQIFVIVEATILLPNATFLPIQTLISNTITNTIPASWPGSALVSSTDGEPAIRTIVGADPPVSTNFTVTVPVGARWKVVSIQANLITDATAGVRTVFLLFTSGGNSLVQVSPSAQQNPSTSIVYNWFVGSGGNAALFIGEATELMPSDMPLIAGDVVQSNTNGASGGDNYGPPIVHTYEWLEPTVTV